MKKESIRTKLLRTVTIFVLVLATVLGTVSVIVVGKIAKTDSEKIMSQISEEESLKLNNKLNLVQHAVEMLYLYDAEISESGEYELMSDAYIEKVREMTISVANNTEGAMAVYLRYSPELTGNGKTGFFWTRKDASKPFECEEITDILEYNANDIQHVGWYYIPKQTGKPTWMNPYYNQNIDVFMISYVIPLYSEDEFIGVLGIDIDFDIAMSIIGSEQFYDDCKIGLASTSEDIIYFVDDNGEITSEKLSIQLSSYFNTADETDTIFEMKDDDGNVSFNSCRKLANGMILYVNIPKKELNANRNNLMAFLVICTAISLLAAIILIWKYTASIVEPLRRLAKITEKYANSDWSENYNAKTGDEIQALSDSIAAMAINTQKYIYKIDHLTRIDTLTGINNRTCYFEDIERVKGDYAIVVMNLNSLKATNDSQGYAAGDLLIREAAKYISKAFSNSDVYRIGGDEFVAVLKDEDYKNRINLLKELESNMGYEVFGTSGVQLNIACGMAECPKDDIDYVEVFKLADSRMHEKKDAMKNNK